MKNSVSSVLASFHFPNISEMKKSLSFNILAGLFFLWIPVSAQWSLLDVGGPQAKILKMREPSFTLSFTGTFPAGKTPDTHIGLQVMQQAMDAPGIREQLFEKLGGMPLIGSLSGQQTPETTLTGRVAPMPGIQLGFQPARRFECRAGVQYFRAEWSGQFPVTVLPFTNTKPETLNGRVGASVSGMSVEAGGAFFLATGKIRPMVGAGVRGQFVIRTESDMNIADIAIPVDWQPANTSFSLYASAGVRAHIGARASLEALVNWLELPGGDRSVAPGLGLGWRF